MSQIKELQPKEGLTLLAWLAPDDFREFAGLVGDHLYYWSKLHTSADYPCSVKLPFSDVEYLGIATEIPEEVWQGIVEEITFGKNTIPMYRNYKYPMPQCTFARKTATESAMSLLVSHEVYSVNPYGKKEPEYSNEHWQSSSSERRRWFKAEANT